MRWSRIGVPAAFALLLLGCQGQQLRASPPSTLTTSSSAGLVRTAAPTPVAWRTWSSDAVAELIGQEAALLSTVRIGIDGAIDPDFASAFDANARRGRRLPGGGYAPSQAERTLNERLKKTDGYGRLLRLLNPDGELEPRASAHFSIDYARTTKKKLTYLETKSRTSHGFEIGVSFVLLDANGREVFRNAVDGQRLLICVADAVSGQQCFGDERGIVSSFDGRAVWQQLLRKTLGDAVRQAYDGVGAWAELLASMEQRVAISRRGQSFSFDQSASDLRNQAASASRFLFLDVPGLLGMDKVVRDLEVRGNRLGGDDRRLLERQYLSAYRSGLDRGLREALGQSRDMRQAGVFLLPDLKAQWFRDAYARLKADAINNDEVEVVLTETGERREWPPHLKQYGQFCSQGGAIGRGNKCLTMSPLYKVGETVDKRYIDNDGTRNYAYVTQVVTTASAIVDPLERLRGCPQKSCYYPQGLPIAKRFEVAVEESPEYLRFGRAEAAQNDDDLYLRFATYDAYEKLGHQSAAKVVRAFRETML